MELTSQEQYRTTIVHDVIDKVLIQFNLYKVAPNALDIAKHVHALKSPMIYICLLVVDLIPNLVFTYMHIHKGFILVCMHQRSSKCNVNVLAAISWCSHQTSAS